MKYGRRDAIRLGLTAGAAAGCGTSGSSRFVHGVASADPTQHSVVLWTRLSDAVADEPVRLRLATNEALTENVRVVDTVARVERDYTVAVTAYALMQNTVYFFAFEAGSDRSAVGRTKTASNYSPEVRFALASCASYAHAYFHTYARIAEEDDLDAVIHLGDYIYEYGDGEYGSLRGYDPPHHLVSQDDYYRRYAHYRRDPDLAYLHARYPWVVTWDDHETANDAWIGGAPGHRTESHGPWPERASAAGAAHYLWLPRVETDDGSLYRRISFGGLVELFVLDTRRAGRNAVAAADASEAAMEGRTILGVRQRDALLAGLVRSTARWKVVASSVQVSPHPEFWNFDAWDGYPSDRDAVLSVIEREAIDGVVFVCGDGHKSFADELPRDPWDAENYDPETGAGSLAVEFMTPAVASPHLFGDEARAFEARVREGAPHTKFVDAEARGYWKLEFFEPELHATLVHVDRVTDPFGGAARVAARFRVAYGNPRLEPR